MLLITYDDSRDSWHVSRVRDVGTPDYVDQPTTANGGLGIESNIVVYCIPRAIFPVQDRDKLIDRVLKELERSADLIVIQSPRYLSSIADDLIRAIRHWSDGQPSCHPVHLLVEPT